MWAVTDSRVVAASAVPHTARAAAVASVVFRSLMQDNLTRLRQIRDPVCQRLTKKEDHYQDDHSDDEGGRDDLRRPLQTPELGVRAVARVAALGRLADP